MSKFVSSFKVYKGAKLVETPATLAGKTPRIRRGIESEWAWTTETGDSFHAALSLYYTSTVLAGEGWWASLLATHDQMSMVRAAIECPMYREKSKDSMCNICFCIILLEDGVWQASKIRHNHCA